jgi:hypothetical protein
LWLDPRSVHGFAFGEGERAAFFESSLLLPPEWEKAYTTLVRKSISLEVALFQEGGEILDVGEVEGGSRVPFQALLKNTPSEGKRKRRQPADMKCHVPWPKNRN